MNGIALNPTSLSEHMYVANGTTVARYDTAVAPPNVTEVKGIPIAHITYQCTSETILERMSETDADIITAAMMRHRIATNIVNIVVWFHI